MGLEIIKRRESEVRSYVRPFPTVFTESRGARLKDIEGREYIDFFAGAGVLNYGHNNPHLKEALIEYIRSDGVTHGLDMATRAKCDFLEALEEVLLQPRSMNYKVMFPGPTGTNAVESSLKLARKVTGRTHVVAFTNAFHGMTLGSLSITGDTRKRAAAGLPLSHVHRMPYHGYHGPGVDTIALMKDLFTDSSSGLELPAAFIVEPIQAEGGINVASLEWLKDLEDLARELGALTILDDIQVGCGRTGPFFSFEEAGLTPDMICLSKSLSGYGLPLAVLLLKPEIDLWSPGEHDGTFRGNNHAFVTGAAALRHYWSDNRLQMEVERKGEHLRERLQKIAGDSGARLRGRGFIWGLQWDDPNRAGRASSEAFSRGLLIETSGSRGQVLKFLGPLTIEDETLDRGLDIVEEAVGASANAPTS